MKVKSGHQVISHDPFLLQWFQWSKIAGVHNIHLLYDLTIVDLFFSGNGVLFNNASVNMTFNVQ